MNYPSFFHKFGMSDGGGEKGRLMAAMVMTEGNNFRSLSNFSSFIFLM